MSDDPLVGRQLANYRLERVLGRGGMAVVYYATDIRLRRPAAVKVIDARFRGDTTYAERFIQEARVVASVHHEHILQIYYAGDEEGLFYFAMEYIDGVNLEQIMASYSRPGGEATAASEPAQVLARRYMPLEDVLRYGRAIAGALDAAHARGIIHRDVKPSNVLVSQDGRIVLGDFGLALDARQGSFGEAFGTAQYMAPEQARRSNAAVAQSDLYSLGVILYEMLTGQLPFDDPSPTSLAIQHLTQPVPDPRIYRPELSEGVVAVLMRALAKQPDDRYPTGLALMLNLEDALIRMVPSLPTVRSQVGRPSTPPTLPGWESAGRAGPNEARQGRGAPARNGPPDIFPEPPPSPAEGSLSPGPIGRIPLPVLLAGLGLVALLIIAVLMVVLTSRPRANLAALEATLTAAAAPALPAPTAGAAVPTSTTLAKVTQAGQPAPSKAAATKAGPAATQPVPAQAQPSPSWTPRYASGRRMVMFWNDSSFYILQASGYGELIEPLVFERLDAQDLGTNRYSSRLWAEYTPKSIRDFCYRLLVGGPKDPPGGLAYLEPAQCHKQYAATRYPAAGDESLFWTKQEGSTTFRVLWGREELQRCEIAKGTCEVYIP